MLRNAVRALVVAGLVGTGWVAGQEKVRLDEPEFELSVTLASRNGVVSPIVTCVRGCRLTWEPAPAEGNAPREIVYPTNTMPCPVSPTRGALPCRFWGWTQP
jgi:hypothetical protein